MFWSKTIVNFFYEMRELFVAVYKSQKWILKGFIFSKKLNVASITNLGNIYIWQNSIIVDERALQYVSQIYV